MPISLKNMDPYEFKDHSSVIKIKKRRVRKGQVKDAMCVIKTTSKKPVHMPLNNVVERHMAYHRVLYPFLTNSQIKGLTLKSLGLPTFMGDIPRSPRKRQLAQPAWWTAELAINNLVMFNYSKLLRQFVSKFQLSERRSVTSVSFERSTVANDNSLYQNLSSPEAHISEVTSDDDDRWQAPSKNLNCSIEVKRNVITKTRYEERNKQVVVTSIDYDEEIETTVNGFMEINNKSSSDVPVSSLKKQDMSRNRSIKSAKSKTASKNTAEDEYNFSEFVLPNESNRLRARGNKGQQKNCSTHITQDTANTKGQRNVLPEPILNDVITSNFKDSDVNSNEIETMKVSHKKKKKLAFDKIKTTENKCTKKSTLQQKLSIGISPKLKSQILKPQSFSSQTLDDGVTNSLATQSSNNNNGPAEQTPVKINSYGTSKVKKLKKRNRSCELLTEKKDTNPKKSVPKAKTKKSLCLAKNLNSKSNNSQMESCEVIDYEEDNPVAPNALFEKNTQDNVPMLNQPNKLFHRATQLFATPLLSNMNSLCNGKSPKIAEENCIREDGKIDVYFETDRNSVNDVDISINIETLGNNEAEVKPEIKQQGEFSGIGKPTPPLSSVPIIVFNEAGKTPQKSSNITTISVSMQKNKLAADFKSVLNKDTESNLRNVDSASCIPSIEVPNDMFLNPENQLEKGTTKNQKKLNKDKESVGKICAMLSSSKDVEIVFEQSGKTKRKSNIKAAKALSDSNQNINKLKESKEKKLKNIKSNTTTKAATFSEQTVTNKKNQKTITKISEGTKSTFLPPLKVCSEMENIENNQSRKRLHKSSEGIHNRMSKVSNTVSENDELVLEDATDTSSNTKRMKASVGVQINDENESEVELENESALYSDEFPQTNHKIARKNWDSPSSEVSIAVRQNRQNDQLYVSATSDSSQQSTGSSTIQISITPKTVEIVDNSEEEYADDEAYEMESLFSKKTTKSISKFVATPRSCQSEADSIVCNRYGNKQPALRSSLNLPQINSATKVSRFLNRLGKDSNSQESYLSASTDLSVSFEETDQESGVSVPYETKSYTQSECSVRSVLANLFDPISELSSAHTSVSGTPTLNSIDKTMPPPKCKRRSISRKK